MTRRMAIDDLAELAVASQPALSPDHRRLVHVVTTQDLAADQPVAQLWITDLDDDGAPRRLTRGRSDTAPAWSPDGSTIAYVRDQQVWLLPMTGGEPVQLTTLPLGAGAPVWSPDGSAIAFSAPVDRVATAQETDADRARRADAPIVSERLDYQIDGMGFVGTVRTQIHLAEVATGEVRQVTEGRHHAQNPAWSPDGTTLVYTAKADGDSDLVASSAVFSLAVTGSHAAPRVVVAEGSMATAGFTPDGGSLLVVGHQGEPRGHAGLFRVDLATGELTDLAAGLDRNVMPGAPAYPGAVPQVVGDEVLFCVRDRGCTHLYAVGLAGGDPRLVHGGAGHVVSQLSVAGQRVAFALATPTSFGEIVTLDLATGAETTVTHHGESLAEVELYERTPREFTISDGTVVEGWLMRDESTSGPGPLLLDIHGGPHNAWNAAADEVHLYHQELVARGWTVLILNPRGSDGYGEKHYDALFGGWGVTDANDFLEPVDLLVAEGFADPARLAVTGYSYGGYMTCYLTSRDTRFAAAVPGGAIADVISMGGTSDLGHYLSALEFGSLPWQDPDRLAEMSPYPRVDQVTTPSLVLHGAADVRCPVGQAEQWHAALRERGVPTGLVLYPGASHNFLITGRPSHRQDYGRRVVDWVERYAGNAAGPRPARIDAEHWARRLERLAARHRVPGAQLGILRLGVDGAPDETAYAATGVLHAASGAPATTDALWQIGSITKVWTATVIMQLIDEDAFTLHTPVTEILPELRLKDEEAAAKVTIWHLLTHTSGIEGDVFVDTGRGDDCLEKYAAVLADVEQIHPVGATWSYSNSAFSLLGRVVEVTTGVTWDQAMRERLFAPLGLTRTVTLPEEAMVFPHAMGHLVGLPEPEPAGVAMLPRSVGPAGLITSTVADVLAFARLHLMGGVAADGTRVVSRDSVAAMNADQVPGVEQLLMGETRGLAWFRFDWNGHPVHGHDGNTIGQSAFLRILPEAGIAVTLLTNGGDARDLYTDLYEEIFSELADVQLPARFAPPVEPPVVDHAPYLGRYERGELLVEFLLEEGEPVLRTTLKGPLADVLPAVETYTVVPVADGVYAIQASGATDWVRVSFYDLPTGEQGIHIGLRATPRKA